MKNIEKKIICYFASILISICCLASIISFILTGNITTCYSSKHPFRHFFSYTYSFVNSVLNRDYIVDSEANVIKLKNGYLSFQKHNQDLTIPSEKIISLNNFLKEKNINYVQIITAEAGDERLGQLPNGYGTNYCELIFTNFIKMLKENNINYINTYDSLINSDEDYYHYFYKTDHHWNDYAGLYVSQIITEYLNQEYSYSLDPSIYNLENYNIKTYNNLSFGSLGKKVGLAYASPEDFDLLIPKFETNFKTNYNRQGSYLNSLIYQDRLIKDYLGVNNYATYLGGDHALMKIENLTNNNGLKVLVLKDSKANVVLSHLASSFQYLDIIDPRAIDCNINDYIEETQPDLVLSIFSPFNREVFYEKF